MNWKRRLAFKLGYGYKAPFRYGLKLKVKILADESEVGCLMKKCFMPLCNYGREIQVLPGEIGHDAEFRYVYYK